MSVLFLIEMVLIDILRHSERSAAKQYEVEESICYCVND